MKDIDKFADEALEFCNSMGWTKDWIRGGCYIHLEVSEFIEALRGKGDPIDELADVFVTLFSVCKNYDIKPSDGLERAREKMKEIEDRG